MAMQYIFHFLQKYFDEHSKLLYNCSHLLKKLVVQPRNLPSSLLSLKREFDSCYLIH